MSPRSLLTRETFITFPIGLTIALWHFERHIILLFFGAALFITNWLWRQQALHASSLHACFLPSSSSPDLALHHLNIDMSLTADSTQRFSCTTSLAGSDSRLASQIFMHLLLCVDILWGGMLSLQHMVQNPSWQILTCAGSEYAPLQ